ncbi:alpha/beta fold hydrolase [Thermodesulfobacteriota bacterium]
MTEEAIQTGRFPNGLPYISSGSGSPALGVFPHIRDTLEDITEARWCRRWLRRFGKAGHRVCIIGRRRDLPAGCTTADMAAEYAAVLKHELGPCPVLGFSLGGLAAQHLALAYPRLVTRLVLAVCGHSIAPDEQASIRGWIAQARQENWRPIYLDIAALMHTGVADCNAEKVAAFMEGALQRPPFNPSGFIACSAASLTHNTAEQLHRIAAPTLLIGGTRDRLFPQAVLQETAQSIPGARLTLLAGAGHGAFDEQKREFDRELFQFLAPHAAPA